MLLIILLSVAALLGLLHVYRGLYAWTVSLGIFLFGALLIGHAGSLWWWLLLIVGLAAFALFAVEPIRNQFVAPLVMRFMGKALPRLGKTERIALEAGDVWWDGELFSGNPDWDQLLEFEIPKLSDAEEAFLSGPVEDLCRSVDDWDIYQRRGLTDETWDFLREHGFFGMIIPTEHGGKGFSAQAHSAVVCKLASRSIPLAVTVMVPNSLGPAELLLHYGTDEQKSEYLPKLASGEHIPCFALTGPEAGSDAAATQSTGVVVERTVGGKKQLMLKLNWRKRYITLSPVATLIGLAFRMQDPDGLIGDREDLGITCALIPRDTKGISIGRRHDPMGVPFQNGPTEGEDVLVPIDTIIGGLDRAGDGWRMLMESLSAGRSISLPALSVGAAELAARVVGAYGTVREQFDTPIGRFEGVEEPLASIGAHAYFMNAARELTCGALDTGLKPSVISAIVKAYLTEGMRSSVTHAMDIRAGAAIMRGPRNILARAYTAVPIGITVEGSNILTRSMIIYGQGAIRCHPYVQTEMKAAADGDEVALTDAVLGHINHVCGNAARSIVGAFTSSTLISTPDEPQVERYYQHLTRMSAAFSFTSDWCMFNLGGSLKRREKISGRLADCIAWLYLASAALKRYHDEGYDQTDLPAVKWTCEHALYQIQTALEGIAQNLPSWMGRTIMKLVVFPLGSHFLPPSDRSGAQVARSLLEDKEARQRWTEQIFVPGPEDEGLGDLETALDKAVAAISVETRLRDAVRSGTLAPAPGIDLAQAGVDAGIITEDELEVIASADACRNAVIQVDSFTPTQYKKLK